MWCNGSYTVKTFRANRRQKHTMPRRRPRGRRRARPRVQKSSVLTEVFYFNIQLGKEASYTVGSLSKPANRNFRPLSVSVNCGSAYIPTMANGDAQGWFVPSAVQIDMHDPTGNYVANSRATVLGPQPRTTTCRYPRSGDWFNNNIAVNSKLVTIAAICIGAPGHSPDTTAYVRGLVRMTIQYGPEALPNACPTPNLLTERGFRVQESWAEEVDRCIPLSSSGSSVQPVGTGSIPSCSTSPLEEINRAMREVSLSVIGNKERRPDLPWSTGVRSGNVIQCHCRMCRAHEPVQ